MGQCLAGARAVCESFPCLSPVLKRPDRPAELREVIQGTWYDAAEKAYYNVVCSDTPSNRLRVFATTCSTVLHHVDGEDEHEWFQGDEIHAHSRRLRQIRIRPGDSDHQAIRKIYQQGAWSTASSLVRVTPDEELARGDYVSLDSLWKALRPRSPGDPAGTVLIRGRWFIEWMNAGKTLPRRQDLPAEAIWQVEHLQPAVEAFEVFLITVSHCWAQKEHPDPTGEQMRILASILETRLAVAYLDGSKVYKDAAIFVDWASLYQEVGGTGRTAAQERSFQSALRDTSLWYAHERTESWLLSYTPDGVMPAVNRGWPFFERAVSCLSTPDHMLFDIGENQVQNEWYDNYSEFKAGRMPPMTPSTFNKALSKKSFTQASDEATLQQQYSEAFHAVMGGTKELAVSNLDWLDADAEAFSEVLPYCDKLEKLDMKSNEICAVGAGAICKGCAQCPVEVVSFTKNPLGDAGARAIADSLAEMTELKTLWLNECAIGNDGFIALMSQAQQSDSLRNLYAFDNRMTDEGVEAIAALLPRCPKLFQLGVGGSQISQAALQRLQRAWNEVPRASGACIYLM